MPQSNWSIVIHGTGLHHADSGADANHMAAELVTALIDSGHDIHSAVFKHEHDDDLKNMAKVVRHCQVSINGKKAVVESAVTFEKIWALSEIGGQNSGDVPSMTYFRARLDRQGMMHPGDTVDAVDGTVFNCCFTGNA